MQFSTNRTIAAIVVIMIIFASYGAGFLTASATRPATAIETSASSTALDAQAPSNVDMSAFWKTWNLMNQLYVGKQPTDQQKVYAATQGLVSSLGDPYSVFFPPTQNKDFQSEITGDFEGVGMEIEVRDNVLTVISPLKGSPAEQAGIKPNDQILEINGTSTKDMSLSDAVNMIRGPKGSTVTVTDLHKGSAQSVNITITRDTINAPVVETDKDPKSKTFIIHLYEFSGTATDAFRNALREFVQARQTEGYNNLVLDLRDNPGGYLEAAVEIASWFLPQGDVVVTEDFGGGQKTVHRSQGYDIFHDNPIHMAILVNSGTASAAEILSGALEQHHVAVLVGDTTFGKGSVQELNNITPDTSLKITVARWLLPDGSNISEKGITPTYPISLTQQDVAAGKDPQLAKAIAVLQSEAGGQ